MHGCRRPLARSTRAVLLPAGLGARRRLETTSRCLPVSPRGFQGYRLVQEYFAFPDPLPVLRPWTAAQGAPPRSAGRTRSYCSCVDRNLPDLDERTRCVAVPAQLHARRQLFPRSPWTASISRRTRHDGVVTSVARRLSRSDGFRGLRHPTAFRQSARAVDRW